jgi:DNA-directed RNA polymerase specialized sigma24 family protein
VKLLCTKRSKPSIAAEYATSDDFRKLFTDGMAGLYLLSYLLTGNLEKAEQCFVAGIEDVAKSNSVFKEWARSWARRAIVQNATRMMAPRPNHAAWTIGSPELKDKLQGTQEQDPKIATVLALEDFERFVFVLSVLERYSDRDCSFLLTCSQEDVRTARIRALQQISEVHHRNGAAEDDATSPPQAVSREGH